MAIDLKYYVMLRRYAELARATYLTAFDMLEKNMEVGGSEIKGNGAFRGRDKARLVDWLIVFIRAFTTRQILEKPRGSKGESSHLSMF